MLRTLWRERHVIGQLGRRQVLSRHRGSMLGVVWTVLNPLLLLAVYTLFFTVLIPVADSKTDRVDLVLNIFAGMIVFGVFSETVGKAAFSITGNPNFVKKVVFPLEALPAADLWAAFVHAAINLGVLVAATLCLQGALPWTLLWLPVTLPPLILLTLGAAWIVASLGVYVRDVATSISVVLTALMFLTPVFYRMRNVTDAQARALLRLNPLTDIVETTRAIVLAGEAPDWTGLAVSYALAALVAQLGWTWFRATKRGFADVL